MYLNTSNVKPLVTISAEKPKMLYNEKLSRKYRGKCTKGQFVAVLRNMAETCLMLFDFGANL